MERCHVCHSTISEEAKKMGWPIARLGDGRYVCPDCYGSDAYCAEGHVLSATSDSSECPRCSQPAEGET